MVQVAELDTDPETIGATLNYFVDTGAMPVSLVGAPGGTDARVGGGQSDPRRVVLRNGRPHADRFALDRDGFRFVHHDTNVADFYNEDEIRRVYYPEVEALIKAASGRPLWIATRWASVAPPLRLSRPPGSATCVTSFSPVSAR